MAKDKKSSIRVHDFKGLEFKTFKIKATGEDK